MINAGSVAFAQEAEEDEASDSDDEMMITVTGSRIKRTEVEGAQPVIIISSEDLAARGATTVFEALKDLTQNSGLQFEGPEAGGSFGAELQTFNLRGVGVGNTLILINGRRITNYPAPYQASAGAVNFGSIPAAAVDQIEILATGASAIYGSDAVAGVVNIKLKRDMEENVLNILYGTPVEAKNKPGDTRLQFITGHTFDNGNLTAIFEYQQRDQILSGEFEEFDSDLDYPFGNGVLFRNNAVFDYWNIYGWALDATNDGYRPPPTEGTCAALNNGTTYSFREGRGNYCGRDDAASTNFRNESDRWSLTLSGNYMLNNDVELFADVMYYNNESRANRTGLGITEDIIDFGANRQNIFGIPWDWYTSRRIFTEQELGRSLDQRFEDSALNISLGARGTWGEQDWEFSFTQSDYELNTFRPWWKAEKVIETFLGTYQGVGFFGDNWWSGNGTFGFTSDDVYKPADIALINDAIGEQQYGNETSSSSLQFVMNGTLTEMENGDLGYAMVLEYERQDFSFNPDERIQQDPIEDYLVGSGWWNLTGYDGTGDRERYALGGELAIPLLETFTVNLAGRIDSYDDVSSSIGTRFTPSITMEWRPSDDILFRAGYSESFRAPDLNYVYTRTGFFTGTVDLVQCYESHLATGGTPDNFDRNDCNASSSFVRRTPGTQLSDTEDALKDETGYTQWVGMSWDVMDDLQFTLDYSEMSLEDRVRTESVNGLLRDEFECFIDSGLVSQDRCDLVSSRIIRVTDPVTGVSFVDEFNVSPINSALQTIGSLDARMFYRHETDLGTFGLNLEWTHTLKNDYQLEAGGDIIDLRDDPIQGGWDFRSIASAQLSYRYEDFTTTLSTVRRGSSTRYRAPNDDGEWRTSAYTTYNLTASYSVNEQLTLAARIINLTSADAPKDDSHLFFDYPWYNRYVYPASALGRQVYLEATYEF
jgi:iron complex outermembrane receptor protein